MPKRAVLLPDLFFFFFLLLLLLLVLISVKTGLSLWPWANVMVALRVEVALHDILLVVPVPIYSGSLLGPAYGPTEEAPRLLARREHSRIGLYYHAPQGPPSDGRTKRCCPRICEYAQPIILGDFRALTHSHARFSL